MWKKVAIEVGFMTLEHGLKKRKQAKKRSKKKTTKRGKK